MGAWLIRNVLVIICGVSTLEFRRTPSRSLHQLVALVRIFGYHARKEAPANVHQVYCLESLMITPGPDRCQSLAWDLQ